MAQASYARTLRNLAKKITHVLANNEPAKAEDILRRYVKEVEPWAEAKAMDMLAQVSKDNANQFKRLSRQMGLDMRAFLKDATVGKCVRSLLRQNIDLITSLPRRAAEEAGKLAHESLVTGMRADDITAEIRKLGAKTEYQAKRIALTEISKAHTALTQVRAADVGSMGYIWRTAHDGGVRESHKGMEGKFVPWDKKPTLDNMTGHAGEFPFCRCYPEPVIPRNDETKKSFKPFLPLDRSDKATQEASKKFSIPLPEPDPIETLLGITRGDPIGYEAAAAGANPKFSSGREYQINCQRCVPTFDLRRRGYDVEAMPNFGLNGKSPYAFGFEGYKNVQVYGAWAGKPKVTKRDLLRELKAMPDGARAGIMWKWKGRSIGHTIACEKVDGQLKFIDPQTGIISEELPRGVDSFLGYSYYRADNLELRDDFDWSKVVKKK